MLARAKAGLSKRWRLRLKAGALALCFVFFALLPWLHILTVDTHAGHGCCHHAAPDAPPASPSPALTPETPDAAEDSCWVCESLASLLQHGEQSDATSALNAAPSPFYVARAPQAPVTLQIYPSSRSQAPPAQA